MSNDPINVFAADAAHQNPQRSACLACLLEGLRAIGIQAPANAIIDFGAIDSADLCATMAHIIESCLSAKGYFIKPLTGALQNLRTQGLRISIDTLTTSLVKLSWPMGEEE